MTFPIVIGGTSTDRGVSVSVDSSGNSYVTGTFRDTVDFDPGAGTTNLTGAGNDDTFIAKYNSDGTLAWAKSAGGTGSDYGRSIAVDSSGNSYLTGNFSGTADFDPGAGTTNLTSAGSDDAFIAKYNSDGTLAWAKNVGGTDFDIGYSIEVDSSGNSYVTGTFQGTADFDPGAGTTNLTSAGDSDVFIAKYDSDGALVWAKSVGETNTDRGNSISVDSSGNSYVTGEFRNTVDFDPGAGTTNLTSAGNRDVLIAKYDSDGALVWAKNVGGTSSDTSYSIEVDSSGNSYVTGNFSGTADFDPGAGTANLTSAGSSDVFIAKYDSDGALAWAKNVSGTSGDEGYSISVDSSGNSYVTGFFQGTADFDPGAGTTDLTSAGGSDVFIAKYNSDGALVWAKNVGGTSYDQGQSISVDSSGNSYVTGYFQGTADFDPGAGTANLTSAGGSDGFIAKYDSDGNFVSVVAQTPGGGSSGGGLTVTDQTSEDVTGTATGRTLVNNTDDTATGALVSNTGNGNVVTATLPSGVSLTTSGTSAALPGSTAGTTLTGEIRANEEEVSQQSFLDGHGQTFITNSGDMALDIRS
ncbi:MAG: SBBP repeat-containing protein, partial [Alphaproteobacteria bacterium]